MAIHLLWHAGTVPQNIRCNCLTGAAVDISYWKRVIHGKAALDSVQESSYISYVAGVSALSMFVIYMARSSMIWYDVMRYGRVHPSFSLHVLMLSLMAI